MTTHASGLDAEWPSDFQSKSEKNQPNGYAGLDADGNLLTSQIPGAASDWSMYALAENGGAFSTYGAQDNQAVYDATSNRTFVTYLGPNEDLWITAIDHGLGRLLTPVKVATASLGIFDSHGVPSLAIDDQGTLHILWGVHGQLPKYAKSTTPYDIRTWTTSTLSVGLGTYHTICFEPSSGELYALYRAGLNHIADGAVAPAAHEYGRLLRSVNRGVSWTEITFANLVSYNGDAYKDFYVSGCQSRLGKVLCTWSVAHGASHDSTRSDQFAALYDPATGHVTTVAGVDQGTSLDSQAKLFACRAVTVAVTEIAQAEVDGTGRIMMAWAQVAGDGKIGTYTALWDGNTWTVHDTGTRTKHIKARPSVGIRPGGGFYVFCITGRDTEPIDTDTSGEQYYYVGAGADASVVHSVDGATFVDHGVVAHRSVIALQGAESFTTPHNAHSECMAIMAPAVVYGNVPQRAPLYAFGLGAVPASYYGQAPLKLPSRTYIDAASNGAGTLVNVTAGAEAPPSAGQWRTASAIGKVPENCVAVLLRLTATPDGASAKARVAFRQKGTTVAGGAVEYTFAANEPSNNIDTRWVPIGPDRQLEWQADHLTTLQAQVLGYELS